MLVRKIAYNTIISLASRILATLIALIIVGLTTRYLGQNGFGLYSTILAFLYIFSVLADLGLYSILVRDISKDGAPESEIASHALSLRFWAGLFIFSVAPIVAWFFPYSFEVKAGILIASFGSWSLSNAQVLMGVFQKYLKMDKVAFAEFICRLFQLALVGFFIWKDFGFLSLVIAYSASAFVNFLLVWFFARKYVLIKIGWDLPYWKKMLRKSFPLAISAIFVMIYFKLDTVMLSLMKSPSDVGIYSAAYKILESLIFLPAMFTGLIMPLLSRYAFGNPLEFQKVSQKTLNIFLIFSIPLAVGGIFLAGPIINLVAGQGFSAAAGILKILIFATSIIFFGALFSNMIVALDKQKSLAKIYALGAAVNFSVNLVLIPKFSYWGAASSTLLTELLVTALMAVVIFKATKKFLNFRSSLKILLACAPMAAILYFLTPFNILLLLPIALLVYFFSLFALKGFSIDDIASLIRRPTQP
ncbi:MAG: flippase [Candidatus Portnoybacteria bacterium]|nr:flippase [Candidatus Portnoybacteria bacterium]